MADSDFERRTFVWTHPDAGRWRARVRRITVASGVALLLSAITVLVYGDDLRAPLGERPERLRCRATPEACEALLPEEIRTLPDPEVVRDEAKKRLLRAFAAHPDTYRPEAGTLDQILRNQRYGTGEPDLAPLRAEQWEQALDHGLVVARTEPVELPDAPWRDWAERVAEAGARVETDRYMQAVADRTAFQQSMIELRSKVDERTWLEHQQARRRAMAGLGGLGLTALLAGLLVLARLRLARCRPIEVRLDRHTVHIGDTRIPVGSLTEARLVELVARLGRDGHLSDDAQPLVTAIRERIEAESRGIPVDAATRAALGRLVDG